METAKLNYHEERSFATNNLIFLFIWCYFLILISCKNENLPISMSSYKNNMPKVLHHKHRLIFGRCIQDDYTQDVRNVFFKKHTGSIEYVKKQPHF